MAMRQEQNLFVKQDQRLVMSHALEQAFHILQLPQLELSEMLEGEIEQNPMLELLESKGSRLSEEELRKREYFQSLIPFTPSLYQILMDQAKLVFDLEKDLACAELIIGNLDEKGFLSFSSLKELSIQHPEFQPILKIIHNFEPVGIAAQNTRESLLIQLHSLDKEKSYAYEIIHSHYDDLLHGRLKSIEKKMHIDSDEILSIIKKDISPLSPFPGRAYAHFSPQKIIPDIILDEIEGKWVIEINQHYLPHFRVNPVYAESLKEKKIPSQEKATLRRLTSSGKWLVTTVQRREKTLFELAKFLLKHQKAFFNGETELMQPMIILDAAKHLGLGESTVARAIQNKHLFCPRGMFPLRKFFSHKLITQTGKVISNDTAKILLLKLIKEENKNTPLSDAKISEKFKKKGINIARRTITKYRKQLRISKANERKKWQK